MQNWPSVSSPSYMHDYTEVLMGDLARGLPPGGLTATASLSNGQDIRALGPGPADKKRRRDEELGLKQWMENLGKPDPPEDLLLHDDTLLFSSPGALDFSMPTSFGMSSEAGGTQGGLGGYDGLASDGVLLPPSSREELLVLPPWETMPVSNGNGMCGQVHSSRGGARGKGGARGGGRGRSVAVSTDDLTELEKSAVSKAGRERARRERLNDSFNELSELLDPGKPSRTDKVSIIADGVKAITQLRAEAHQLRQLNKFLEERVSHSEKEKSHLMMQQALITQFMQTGQPVVLGGAKPAANFWGQQQPAGPPPQVPASGQSMGQAVADISAGLRLMQQSTGSSLPPWPLPPGAQSQGAGPSHAPVSPPGPAAVQAPAAPARPRGISTALSPAQQQQQQQEPGGLGLRAAIPRSPFLSSPTSQGLRTGSGGGGTGPPVLQGAVSAPQLQRIPSGMAASSPANVTISQSATGGAAIKEDMEEYASPAMLQPVQSQAQQPQPQQQRQQFAPQHSNQHGSYAPRSVPEQQQQQQPFVGQQYVSNYPQAQNLALPPDEVYGSYQPVPPPQQRQDMQPPYMQGMGTFSTASGPVKQAHLGSSQGPVPVMPGPFWLGGLDTDTSNDHVRRPPAA